MANDGKVKLALLTKIYKDKQIEDKKLIYDPTCIKPVASVQVWKIVSVVLDCPLDPCCSRWPAPATVIVHSETTDSVLKICRYGNVKEVSFFLTLC